MAAEITDQVRVETNREAEKESVEQARAPETPMPASASASAQAAPAESHRDGGEHPSRDLILTLPFFKAQFKIPRPPSGPVHVGPVTVSSPGKAVYYVGLGALALAEVVEWPIALAIGAGTYVAQHTRADEPALPHMEHAGHAEPTERPEHAEPTEPAESTEHVEPTERPEHAEPAESTEHVEPARAEGPEPSASPA